MKWNRVFQTAAVLGLCATAPAWAIDTFSGHDFGPGGGTPGTGPLGADDAWGKGDPKPNADAALASWTAAATANPAAAGSISTVGFEAPEFTAGSPIDNSTHLAPGSITQIAPGVSVRVGEGSRVFISNTVSDAFGSPANGDQRLWFDENQPGGEPTVELEFIFDNPISAFGSFFVGADKGILDVGSGTFANDRSPGSPALEAIQKYANTSQTYALTEEYTPGVEFFGFVGNATNSVVVRLNTGNAGVGPNNEILAIDDLFFIDAAVPEPFTASLAGMGMGALALQMMRRRRA